MLFPLFSGFSGRSANLKLRPDNLIVLSGVSKFFNYINILTDLKP